MQTTPPSPAPLPAQPGHERSRLRLLVIDPDFSCVEPLYRQLSERNVDVVVTADPADGLVQAGVLRPDLVLAAVQAPPMHSSAIVRAISARTGIPVLVGVSRKEIDVVEVASAAGAAGCVLRPYHAPEIWAFLKDRSPGKLDVAEAPLVVGELELDPAAQEVRLNGRRITMPPREFELLHLLMSHAGRVLPRHQILRSVWSNNVELSNTLSVHIKRLRSRLGDDPRHPAIIVGVRGLGYRLDPPL